MNQPAQPDRSTARKFRWLAIAVVVVVLLICGGWFLAAQLYKLALEEGQDVLARQGITLTCNEEELGGFPARFEWRCSSFSLNTANGATISGGAFNTVAPVWNPLFTIVEWQGPYQAVSATGLDAVIDSPLMRASVRANTSLELERLSVVLDPFSVTFQGAQQPIGSGQGAELHARQPETSPAGSLEIAALLFGVESLFLGGVSAVDLSLTGTAEDLAYVRASSLPAAWNSWIERSGRLAPMAVRVRLDDHAIDLTGDATVASNGVVDFDGAIATNDVARFVELMGIDASNGATAIIAGATLLGRQTTIGDDQATELPLIVEQGAVRIGPVPVGFLPPLQF